MSFEYIKTEIVDGVFELSLNRPEVRNAISYPVQLEMEAALREADADDAVSAVLMRGEGKAFSSGHDLQWSREVAASYDSSLTPADEGYVAGMDPKSEDWWVKPRNFTAFWEFRKPLIAAVHGYVGPYANALIAPCDFVIAASGTKFSFETMRFGAAGPPWGPYAIMAYQLPMRVINKLWLMGGWFDAEQGLEYQFVQRVVGEDELLDEARRWARHFTHVPVGHIIAAKRGIHRMYELMGLEATREVGYRAWDHGDDAGIPGNSAVNRFGEILRTEGMKAAIAYRDSMSEADVVKV
jgi:enoyl-CoA hydratase/carnithine racemase